MKNCCKTMNVIIIVLVNLIFISAEKISNHGYCEIGDKSCKNKTIFDDEKLIFYDINPPEGFNLRRDVYMRFAIMLAEARKAGKHLNWKLVLPPWYGLYHWRNHSSRDQPHNWALFFDLISLKSYAPVQELHQVFSKTLRTRTSLDTSLHTSLEIDVLYVLQNYADPFERGAFVDKWDETKESCTYDGQYWGYKNITAKEIICIRFQGKISKLWELISLHPKATKVMFAHSEIPLHDSYGTKSYWECRKSMKFNEDLVKIAEDYIERDLDCFSMQCGSYISVHWRRGDFSQSRKNDVPSIEGTAKQIHEIMKETKIKKVFIATDAPKPEKEKLENILKMFYDVFFFRPSQEELDMFTEGGVAIIDQIICSRAAIFIGTHESTFTFRIQEEREILHHFDFTTFNRLCPDEGKCEKPSKWTIVE